MSLIFPKNPPIRSKKHLARIRQMRCVVCWAPPPSEAAHLRLGLAAGVGMKPEDRLTLPMCHEHHVEQTLSKTGEHGFWRGVLSTNKQLLVEVMRSYARSL